MRRELLEIAALDMLSIPPLIHRRIRRKFVRIRNEDPVRDSYISPQHFEIVALLDEEGTMQVAEIARKLQIAKAQMTQLMDKLSELGMIDRETNQDDRRAINVSLSDHGKTVLEKNKTELRKAVKVSMSDLSDDDLRVLSASLRKVQEILAILK